MPLARPLLFSTLLFLPFHSPATVVHRCDDGAGSITFTTLGCQPGQNASLQDAFNAPPGTQPSFLPPAEANRPPLETTHAPARELVVVGQHEDGCGNRLSAEQRRKAVLNLQAPAGMTQRDVESMLGKPDKIARKNGEVRYAYKDSKGNSSQVTFDENGCVKGK